VNYEYKPSFDRTFKKLRPDAKKRVTRALTLLIDFFETGQRTSGLGLKQLRGSFWEIRVDIKIRVIFTFEGDTVSFIVVGTHDDITRFLRKS
jgi:mRNA-degrading endonuclease RelE of RelBE toxin-antitoxin system